MPKNIHEAIEIAHHSLWSRHIKEDGIILDNAGPRGEVDLPNPSDCAEGRPNCIGWWSPIENGAFFNGLYLPAQCERARRTGAGVDREGARRLAHGLLRLSEVSTVPGFIGRGIGSDGASCYPLGSDDQTHPWFLGLHAYLRTDIPTPAERGEIADRMIAVGRALEVNQWRCPCTGEFRGQFRGDFTEPCFRGAARYLYLLRLMSHLTGDPAWLRRYHDALGEKPHGAAESRLEIIARGCPYDLSQIPDLRFQMWITAGAQASLVELIRWETDPGVLHAFQTGMGETAGFARETLGEYIHFEAENIGPCRLVDWRRTFSAWRPQHSQQEAGDLAMELLRDLGKMEEGTGKVSRFTAEHRHMRQPLAAAFIIALSCEPERLPSFRADLEALLTHYDYPGISSATFFFAECAYYAGKF